MHRSQITAAGYLLAAEMSPGEGALQIHMRGILEEFTRKLADTLITDHKGSTVGSYDFPKEPKNV